MFSDSTLGRGGAAGAGLPMSVSAIFNRNRSIAQLSEGRCSLADTSLVHHPKWEVTPPYQRQPV